MEIETLLFDAIQSSILLGLLHGINPCGHSWLVLAPFVSGEKNGSRVSLLTTMFLGGTAVACLFLGATLGAVSQIIPPSMGTWVEVITSIILIIIGLLLLYDPHILHSHENGIMARIKRLTKNKKLLPPALFAIGFVNMIIPCPTAAVMYTYALNAGSVWSATVVFGTYALSTAIAVGAVIYLIFKATTMAHNLQKDWVEPFIMRSAGVIIIVFSTYGIYQSVMA
jgi:nickel/cobalt exporter